MAADDYGLRENPFDRGGEPLTFVCYRAQQDAFRYLNKSLFDERGVAHLFGPGLSGKTTLVRRFAGECRSRMSVTYVDGDGLQSPQLLSKVLELFGYDVAPSSTEKALRLLQDYIVQQARSDEPPLLIVDNMHRMSPDALSTLCRLAAISAGDQFALRMLMVSQGDCTLILQSDNMLPVANRVSGSFELSPLTATDATRYLYAKLKAAGASRPDDVFPVAVCDRLIEKAGRLPGLLERFAAEYLEGGESDEDSPRLIVTRAMRPLMDVRMIASRVLVGRSQLSDILLTDRFISAQHALIVWENDAVILVDLNSSNGTFVNSRRIKSQFLRHNDIIQLGDHRIKLSFPRAGARSIAEDPDIEDTAKMKNIADVRRERAFNTVSLRAVRQRGSL